MNIICEPKQDGTPPLEQLIRHFKRRRLKQAVIAEIRMASDRAALKPRREYWTDLVNGLITKPPYLHRNEAQFLTDMIERLDGDELPTGKQQSWIKKIDRKRRG